MATPFAVKIITPEKVFFDGETEMLIVRSSEGELGIMANHISLVVSLPSSPLRIQNEDGTWHTASLSTGLLKVGGNKATVIANAVEWAEDIDLEWAKRSEEEARTRLKAYKDSDYDYRLAELKLKRALNRQNVGRAYK
ncbi:MAG: ATP synthase F1 subunit epsilon [Ruminococcus sp.]|jgi:F-type H+-transporting ATPase subunit epsilon|nr:ATP synthase F1 subunit epsilon [Ruminococcus sp.]